MNAIGPATGDIDSGVLDARGGLVWWYVDLVDADGNGAVVIWSWGLPFLPGIASAARRGHGVPPRSRPSVNVAVYREGRPDFYVLRELEPEACGWEPGHWWFGDTWFRRRDTGPPGERRVRLEGSISLELSAPRLPLRGRLEVEGPLRSGLEEAGPRAARNPDHSWEPITLGSATGALELACGAYEVRVEGRAYHDRNGGRAPLHGVGLTAWRWGRFALPDGELVITTVEGRGEDFVVWADASGRAERLPVAQVTEAGLRASWFGPRWPAELRLSTARGELVVYQEALVDDAPFYQRALGRATLPDGREGPGLVEYVRVDRLDPDWMRPLVRMRVDGGLRRSMWLPLFSGPRGHRTLWSVLRGGRV